MSVDPHNRNSARLGGALHSLHVDPDELVTIDTLSIPDAEIARATLDACGIDAVLGDENVARLTEARVQGGIRLQVRRRDAEWAREVLRDHHVADAAEWPATDDAVPDETERCRRCFSEEIYPAESRSRSFARIIAFTWLALVMINLASCGVAMAGLRTPQSIFGALYAVAIVLALFAVVFSAVAPRKRCRNCGLEWRGTPRTA